MHEMSRREMLGAMVVGGLGMALNIDSEVVLTLEQYNHLFPTLQEVL